jgi:hypothetical protein
VITTTHDESQVELAFALDHHGGLVMPPLYRVIDEFDPIRVLVQVSPTTDENLREHLDAQLLEMQSNRGRTRKTVVVIDASLGTRPTPLQRKMQADWINEHRELLATTCLGVAFVIPSPLVRGALTAIFWIAQMPIPHTVHGSLASAIEWAGGRLAAVDVDLPAPLRVHGAAALAVEVAAARGG